MYATFEKMAIGAMTARNRIVRAATAESLATPAGRPTPQLVEIYRKLAQGGVGTVITGYAYVLPDGKPSEGALGLCDDAFAEDYRELVDGVHGAGAKIVAQLVYGGSKSKLAPDDPRWLAPATKAAGEVAPEPDVVAEPAPTPGAGVGLGAACVGEPNVSILGASSLEHPKTHLVPMEATRDDLARLARAFGEAAARAKSYGFDGVEVHVAHGYVLSQFLSRRFNVRTDEYGGEALANRARLALECTAAVRSAVGEGFPVLVKLNSCDDREDPTGMRGGLSEDESALVAAWLVEAGASAIEVSGDWHAVSPCDAESEPFFADFGARLASVLDVPVIVTGGWRRLDAVEEHLARDGIAGVGMSRPLICEPDLPARWRAGNAQPSRCTACGHCQKRPGIPCALGQ